ncbi:MAG: galactokinase family protein [Clostridia bacterium]
MNTNQLLAYLDTPPARAALDRLYAGNGAAALARYQALVHAHEAHFGPRDGVKLCSAPGRAEIAGNHTDHNHGRVLAAAVNLDTLAAVSPNDTGVVTLYSEGYAAPFVLSLSDLSARPDERETTNALIRGVAARLKEEGLAIGGFDAVVTSTVFKGSGLSSSAAFEVMLCEVFDALYGGMRLDKQQRARVSQFAENQYFGKPSGLLDQMASSVGGLVTMDFKESPAHIEALSYDFAHKGYQLAVVSAGGDHGNLTSEYAAIPHEMKLVAQALGASVLRDIAPEAMMDAIPRLKNVVPDRAILRALHFYDEDARIAQLVASLKSDDLPSFLQGIIDSGESSWKLLQNLSVAGSANQEMALALELSRRMLAGRGAWRIHGGGFAGTILAFVPTELLASYARHMDAVFGPGACTPLAVRPVGPCTLPE